MMKKHLPIVLSLAFTALGAARFLRAAEPPGVSTAALSAETAHQLIAPRRPPHAQRVLESATDVTRDLLETLTFIEAGQSFYKAYARGTHTPQENKAFVGFLEDYEREVDTAKKEFAILQSWFEKSSGLKGG